MTATKDLLTRTVMMMMTETWKDISGYEGLYQVSDLGRVRSLDRVVPGSHGVRCLKGKNLRPCCSGNGFHLVIGLHRDGKQKTQNVHTLVADAFLGDQPSGTEVLHGLNKSYDNSVPNLRYGTRSENSMDKWVDGTMPHKPVRRSDGTVFRSTHAAAKETKVHQSGVSKACRGIYLQSGGYGWSFISQEEYLKESV